MSKKNGKLIFYCENMELSWDEVTTPRGAKRPKKTTKMSLRWCVWTAYEYTNTPKGDMFSPSFLKLAIPNYNKTTITNVRAKARASVKLLGQTANSK